MAREIARGDVLCEALLVSAYHRINIKFFFSVATPSASHVLTRVYRLSEPQAYVRISVAVHSAIHLMSHNAGFVSGAPRFMLFHVSWYVIFISWRSTWRGISSFVVLHLAWHFTHSNLVVLHVVLPFTQSRRV